MKLLTYKLQGDDKERLGMMCSFAFHRFIPIEDLGLHFRDMNDLIQNMTREQRTILEHACEKPNKRLLCYEDVVRCVPILPGSEMADGEGGFFRPGLHAVFQRFAL